MLVFVWRWGTCKWVDGAGRFGDFVTWVLCGAGLRVLSFECLDVFDFDLLSVFCDCGFGWVVLVCGVVFGVFWW